MPAYHSAFNEGEFRSIGNMALLPIKTKIRGPAPTSLDPAQDDIIDEAIGLFRANCFFRNFEIKGNADRVLIYLILFIQECLAKLAKNPSLIEGQRTLATHAVQNFAIPGDSNFPLNALYEKPASRQDADNLKQYLSQLRQELAVRLPARVYDGDRPSKWWMSFSKRKFMGLPNVGTQV
ncbi:subunit of the Arp2/3 complex [Rhizophlyctis rosea]|nr:subunit of the Arp2/3 complex [Rhizophlyctis rosea]